MTAGRLADWQDWSGRSGWYRRRPSCQGPVHLGGNPMGARGGANAAPLPPGSATMVGNMITNLVPQRPPRRPITRFSDTEGQMNSSSVSVASDSGLGEGVPTIMRDGRVATPIWHG